MRLGRGVKESDSNLNEMIRFLNNAEDGTLARRITLESSKFELDDWVLYYESAAFRERDLIVVHSTLQPKVLEEAHYSCFGGHCVGVQ